MRKFMWMLTVTFFTVAGFAQVQVPGSFSTPVPSNTPVLVSPPTISYGNGVTPTVVTTGEVMAVTSPVNMAVQPNEASLATAAGTATTTPAKGDTGAPQHFEFIKAPGNGQEMGRGSVNDTTVSLGDVARQMRQNRTATRRTMTNADVAQLPGGPTQPVSDSQLLTAQNENSQQNASGNAASTPASSADRQQPAGTEQVPAAGGMATTITDATRQSTQQSQSNTSSGTQTSAGSQDASAQPWSQPSAAQNAVRPAQPVSGVTEPATPSETQSESQSRSGATTMAATTQDNASGASANFDASSDSRQQLPRTGSSLPLIAVIGGVAALAGAIASRIRA